jgi:hypothetical protein
MKIILDTNIYDLLAKDTIICALVRELVETERLTVIVTSTIAEELWESPFHGIPGFFKTEYEGNTVSRCGIMCAGDRLGPGDVFDAHLGSSIKQNDALIADAASWYADWIVSEDQRLRKRFCHLKTCCIPMAYDEYKRRLMEKFCRC